MIVNPEKFQSMNTPQKLVFLVKSLKVARVRNARVTNFWSQDHIYNIFYTTKGVKTKSQKVLVVNSYACRSYSIKTGSAAFLVFCPHPDMGYCYND